MTDEPMKPDYVVEAGFITDARVTHDDRRGPSLYLAVDHVKGSQPFLITRGGLMNVVRQLGADDFMKSVLRMPCRIKTADKGSYEFVGLGLQEEVSDD
mgnify:CR=1 FL=1